jgi:hypothetical protein
MRTCLFSVLLTPALLLAQGSSLGSSYLLIPSDARVAALAQATVADPSHFSSSFLNPAILATSRSPEILLSHTQWVQDVQTEFLGASAPFSFGKLGFALSNLSIGGIEAREIPGAPLSTFAAHSAVLQLLFATNITDDVSLGTNLKYMYEKIYVDETSGYGVDLGFLYRTPVEGLFIGVSLTNNGSMSGFRTTASDLPTSLQAGAMYRMAGGEFDVSVNGAFVRETKTSRNRLNAATELDYDGTLLLRLGYQTGYESHGITTGLGFRYSILNLDYSYIPWSQGLGNVHIVSLGFLL